MRTKSKYRQQYRDGGRVDPHTELPIEPPAEQPVETVIAAPEAPPAEATVEQPSQQPVEPQAEQPQRDDATLALKRQIESLRQSEQVRQAPMPQQAPMTREQRLAEWQAQGLSDAEVQFFQSHPAMVDFPQITSFAIHRAKEAGLERGTEAHFATVEKIFNANLSHLQEQVAQPSMQPTPNFFRPPAGPRARSAPNPSSLVSAPVSGEIPTASGKRPTPGKVVLTPSEVEAARIANISVEEYARQKLLYAGMRADGSYRDGRD